MSLFESIPMRRPRRRRRGRQREVLLSVPEHLSLPREVESLLLHTELKAEIVPSLCSLVHQLGSACRLGEPVPSGNWLLLMYAAGYLALAAWELAREEPNLTDYLEEALPEMARQGGTDHPAVVTESWLRAMGYHAAQLAGLLATLHPVVKHMSGKSP